MNSLDILQTAPFNLSTKSAQEIMHQIANMSLADKVGQLFFLLHFDKTAHGDMFDICKKYKPGGLMFRPTNEDVTKSLVKFADKEMAIRPFFSANVEMRRSRSAVRCTSCRSATASSEPASCWLFGSSPATIAA